MKKTRLFFSAAGTITLFFAALSGPAFADSTGYSGNVFDSETGKPVPGVLVSAGYTLCRTTTDAEGHFSLNVPELGVHPSARLRSAASISLIWNKQQRTLDLSRAEDITAVSIYRLTGSRVFHRIIGRSRQLSIPQMAPGIYLLNLRKRDNGSFSWKFVNCNLPGIVKIAVPSVTHRTSTLAALGTQTRLIFRHDDYYPHEWDVFEPSDNLIINMKPDPRGYVFDQSKVHSYYFTLTHDDSLNMERNALKEEYTAAEFTLDSTSFGKVGLRYKGSDYYSMPHCFDKEGNRADFPECENVSLKVKFNAFNDTARFYAMKRINLHSMSYDDSKLREMLSYGIFREMGIYTCRTAFVKVYINGVFRGLFTAVEEVDGRFTKSRWPSGGDGNLYKEAWPFRSLKSYYLEALKTNDNFEDSANVNRMVDFYKAVKASTPETFITNISPFLDLDYWLRAIVVDRAIHNADGMMTWYTEGTWLGNHNYYFYEEETQKGKFWLIPWDLNVTLYETDGIFDDYGVPEWNVAPENCTPMEVWGGSLVLPPNCDKLTSLTAATLWKEFVAYGEQFLAGIFTADGMKERISRLAKIIEPVMADEPSIDSAAWQKEIVAMKKAMDPLTKGFDDYIHGRDSVPDIDTSGFFTSFPGDSGFLIDRVNNFEFSPALPTGSWASAYISDSSTISLALDTLSPLWGKADMRCSFVFRPLVTDTPESYSEWAAAEFTFADSIDLTGLKSIRINLKCDVTRYCRVRLLSDVYDRDDFSVSDEYGWTVYVNAKDKQFTLYMNDIAYPTWGDPGNPDVLDSVLTAVTGIGVSPFPRFNDKTGELSVVPDSGYIRIDNISFEF